MSKLRATFKLLRDLSTHCFFDVCPEGGNFVSSLSLLLAAFCRLFSQLMETKLHCSLNFKGTEILSIIKSQLHELLI